MKIKFFRFVRFAILAGMSILLVACSGGSDDGGDDCDCDDSPVITQDGIVMRFEKKHEDEPANISVLFKIETENGEPITGIGANNFQIFEDNFSISEFESQQAILPKPEKFTSHTLLLLDLSGSILESERGLESLKEAAQSFVYAMMPDPESEDFGEIEMGIWWFDGAWNIHSLVDFSSDADRLLSGIDSIEKDISHDNSTNLYGAVIRGMEKLENMANTEEDSTVLVGSLVMFTDGRDQASRNTKNEALRAVKNAGDSVSVYSIGLKSEELDEETLVTIGRDGFLSADNIQELVPKFEEIADTIRKDVNSYYLLEYCSPKREGSHDLKISVSYGVLSGTMTTCFCASDFRGGCEVPKD